MNTVLIVAPLLVGILALLYIILANLLRVWLDHRVKIALLDHFQRGAGANVSLEDIKVMLDEDAREAEQEHKVDYIVTGATLSGIGLCTALGGYLWGHGQASAGVYFGGVVCVSVGAILVLLGLLIRYLTRLPIDSDSQRRP